MRQRARHNDASFSVVRSDAESITIRDNGPWDVCLTITNDAEGVVSRMSEYYGLGARRLFYYDSENVLDELLHDGPTFTGFAPGPREAL